MMNHVEQLLDSISTELKPVEDKTANHEYVALLEKGEIARGKLNTFAAEQLRIISSDLRSVAYLISRSDTPVTSDFFSFVLVGEQMALANLGNFISALGATNKELSQMEPIAEAQAYRNYMAWLALQGPMAGVAAAFLVNFPAWGSCCGRMASALQSRYGIKENQVSFFTGFATPSQEFANKAHLVIAEGLNSGVTADEIKSVAKLLQHYELMYWDSMLVAATR